MAIKSRSIRATITGGAGTALSAIWSVYSAYTVASALPEDAGAGARMLADPPIYLPYLLLAACVMVLAWSLWPRKEETEASPEAAVKQDVTGSHATQFANVRDVTIIHNPPAPRLQAPQQVAPRDRPVRLGPATTQPPRPPMHISDDAMRAVEGLPPIQYDIKMAAFLERIYKKLGERPSLYPSVRDSRAEKVDREIIDQIVHRPLRVWGRLSDTSALLPIRAPDLQHATVDHRRQELTVPGPYRGIKYQDLHFNGAEIDAAWPPSVEDEA